MSLGDRGAARDWDYKIGIEAFLASVYETARFLNWYFLHLFNLDFELFHYVC